jgi:hypothetical protein
VIIILPRRETMWGTLPSRRIRARADWLSVGDGRLGQLRQIDDAGGISATTSNRCEMLHCDSPALLRAEAMIDTRTPDKFQGPRTADGRQRILAGLTLRDKVVEALQAAGATGEMVAVVDGIFGEAQVSQRAKWAASKRRQRVVAVPVDRVRLGGLPPTRLGARPDCRSGWR